ncbi:MAG: T9SS type A sorting domain-containing protein [Bacteroidetes bacterium]|nr:T9SS type A sorting domain-containing protein [Bacteroidota bacterium]
MKKIAILMLLLFSLESIAQTYQENLEKYWYYRHVLKDKFMHYNGDASVQGAHHVAENKYEEQQFVRWSDGVWWLGHYISVLALEYKLLKTNGQDYSETLDELNLAYDTYYRLDYSAEPCFNDPFGQQGTPTINGFFLRDDLDSTCAPYFEEYEVIGSYHNCQTGEEKNVNSQDQCIMMFLGLSLARKLVDDVTVQQRTIDIADLVIKSMHWYNPLVLHYVWEIRNPVTWKVPEVGGSVLELMWNVFADAQAATIITGTDQHVGFSGSPQSKSRFDITQSQVLSLLHGDLFDKFDGYFTSVNSALINDGQFFSSPVPDHLAYDWLYNIYNETKGFEGMPSNVGLFPHLPLITEILHGYNGNNQMPASVIENDFLNVAPSCGAQNYGVGEDENTSPPWHTMSLFCPWHGENSAEDWHGEYNMLDYMLLYNAYFYIYLNDITIPAYVFSSGICPEFINLPDPHEDYWIYTIEDPKHVIAAKHIEAHEYIDEGGGCEYKAGNKIKFVPGFSAKNGSYMLAAIDPLLEQNPYYCITNVDPCDGGNIEPIKVVYKKVEFPVADRSVRFHENNYQVNNKKIIKDSLGYQNHAEERVNNKITDKGIENVTLYPNPTSGVFKINIPVKSKPSTVEIRSYTGQVIYTCEVINESIIKFDLSAQSSGVYHVYIKNKNTVNRFKVVKY